MSGPTKGMVAGQPIQTGTVTDEYRESHERMFGPDKKVQRGRYRYDPELGKCVPIDADWSDSPRQPLRVDVSYMDGLAAQDGSDISSKRKRGEYMKRNNLADAQDFSGHWKKKERERAERFSSGQNRKAVHKAVVEAYRKLRKP